MPTETEKLLSIEDSSEKLLMALKELHGEANSYKASKEQLEAVRSKLVGLISATEQTAKGAHEAVTTLKSIGGPEILRSINAVSEKLDQESKVQQGQLARLKMLLLCALGLSAIAVIVGIVALMK